MNQYPFRLNMKDGVKHDLIADALWVDSIQDVARKIIAEVRSLYDETLIKSFEFDYDGIPYNILWPTK